MNVINVHGEKVKNTGNHLPTDKVYVTSLHTPQIPHKGWKYK